MSAINPVYPYDLPRSYNLMPPFYSSDGFEEKPTATLALSCRNPISTETGKLGLKFGLGLSLNTDGELEAGNGATLTQYPLKNDNGRIHLLYANPFTVATDSLALKVGSGLDIDQNGDLINTNPVPYTYSPPLQSSNTTVSLDTQAPFIVNNDKLALNLASSFAIDPVTNQLTLADPFAPLTLTSGSLGLSTGGPMIIKDQKLDISISDPMQLSSNALTLKIADPCSLSQGQLTVNTAGAIDVEQGSLVVKAANPLTIAQNALQLKLGAGLGIDGNNALYVTALQKPDNITVEFPLQLTNSSLGLNFEEPLTLTAQNSMTVAVNSPLNINGNAINLNAASPLTVTGSELALNVVSPLTVNGDDLALNVASPLSINGNDLGLNVRAPMAIQNGDLTVKTNAPLQVSGDSLNLSVSAPLVTQNNTLSVGLKAPITLQNSQIGIATGKALTTVNNALGVKSNKGLEVDNNNDLNVKLGQGLQFDANNAVSLINNNSEWALWTGTYYANNVVETSTNTPGTLYLQLYKVGGTVYGSTFFRGTAMAKTTSEKITLKFLSNGTLDTSASAPFRGNFGWLTNKNDASPNVGNGLNAALMMPNFTYNRNAPLYCRQSIWSVGVTQYPNGDRVEYWVPFTFTASFNKETDSSHPFTITLLWERDPNYNSGVPNFIPAYFSYIANQA